MAVDWFRLYLVTDRLRATGGDILAAVGRALAGGVRSVQLREKDLPGRQLYGLALAMRELTARHGARLLVNDRVDVALAAGADGVHLGVASIPPGEARRLLGPGALIGCSTHDFREVAEAAAGGADFVTFGPVYATPSKAAYGPPVGVEALRGACAAETVPKGQSDKAHDIYRAGKVQYDDNNHDAALALFKDAYNRDCSKHDLLIIISRAYELKGDRVEAVRALELFLERDPKNTDADSYRRRIAKDQMKATVARFGRVGSCFANAGMGITKPFLETSVEDWEHVQRVNLRGTFLTFREAARHMVARGGGGKLVAIASVGSIHGMPRQESYSASKAGITALVRSVAVELAKHDIQANTILPGWIATDMTEGARGWEKLNATIVQRTPARRWGQPEDFEAIAVYLASPATKFHTGDVVRLDGGCAIFSYKL